jgi:hypothetical protein
MSEFKLKREIPEGAIQKLIRAEKHLAELEDALIPLNSGTTILIPEVVEGAKSVIVKIFIKPKVSAAVSAIAGDVLFGIRCALDHMVCAIASEAGTVITRDHMFPITFSPSGYAKAKEKQLNGLPEVAKSVIERFQPFSFGTDNIQLEWLNCLHNADKHRALNITVVSYACQSSVMISPTLSVRLDPGLRDGEAIVTESSSEIIDRHCLYQVEIKGSMQLEFVDKLRNAQTGNVLVILKQILDFVKTMIVPKVWNYQSSLYEQTAITRAISLEHVISYSNKT